MTELEIVGPLVSIGTAWSSWLPVSDAVMMCVPSPSTVIDP